jgi:hypothetical protein
MGISSMARVWLPRSRSRGRRAAEGLSGGRLDRSNTNDSVDLQFRGPILGLGFTF